VLHAGQYDLTGRNLPKIPIADFTRVVERTGILEREAPRDKAGQKAG
jgi:hypothetical protein